MVFDALVLAGGGARRLGGIDKASIEVAGRSLLERALAATQGARHVVVVGPRRATPVPVEWAREMPVGGGPLEATAAGLARVTSPLVVVLGVDYPLVDSAVVQALLDSIGERDGAALSDAEGVLHYVVGAYRTAALREVIEGRRPEGGGSMRGVFDTLDIAGVSNERAAFDIDVPHDLERARALAEDG
ncbi:MAG: molybdenum cofactor guanylyltransferase [Actinomycetota bacterium]